MFIGYNYKFVFFLLHFCAIYAILDFWFRPGALNLCNAVATSGFPIMTVLPRLVPACLVGGPISIHIYIKQ